MNGDFLPLHLRSFIYSPAGYSYIAIAPIAIFGLNEFSVRLPSALFGIATVLAAYFLVYELFKSYHVSLLTSLLLAISPWHINLSRTATENVLVVFFVTLGIYLYIRSQFLYAFLSFSLSMLLYQASRAFLPFFVPLLIFSKLSKKIRYIVLLSVLFIFIPILLILTSPTLSLRLRTVGIPASPTARLIAEEAIREDGVGNIPVLLSRVLHNKALGFTGQFLENYFSHFSYAFLFTDKGLPDRYRVPGAPLVYLIELPLIILGLIALVHSKTWQSRLLLGWIIIAPIGSGLAFDDVPNLQRTLLFFPAFSIIAAAGFSTLIKPVRLFVVVAYALSVFTYLHAYYIHEPLHRPWFRQEGYRQLVAEVQKRTDTYPSVVITNRETAPTIFFLFYTNYDPVLFLSQTKDLSGDDRDRTSFDKYIFTTEECPLRELSQESGIKTLTGNKNTLYVNFGTCDDAQGTKKLATIARGDGSTVFKLVAIAE